jgi:hypothetical protein
MKKLHILFAFALTMLFASCGSSLFDETAKAYEESTKELANAKSEDDCQKIHDDLMQKLYKITQDYPDWEDIIKNEDKDSEAFKKVDEAYKAWGDALCKASKYSAFMTFCTFENAIKQIEGKSSQSDAFGTSDSEESSDEMSSDSYSSSDQDVDDMLDSYEEYVDKLTDFYGKLKDLDPTSSDYMELMGEATELEGSHADLVSKCKGSVSDFTSEQMYRYNKITSKLTDAMKSLH